MPPDHNRRRRRRPGRNFAETAKDTRDGGGRLVYRMQCAGATQVCTGEKWLWDACVRQLRLAAAAAEPRVRRQTIRAATQMERSFQSKATCATCATGTCYMLTPAYSGQLQSRGSLRCAPSVGRCSERALGGRGGRRSPLPESPRRMRSGCAHQMTSASLTGPRSRRAAREGNCQQAASTNELLEEHAPL